MSKFLKSLVRSQAKSCDGKIKFPREDSAERSARNMEKKKANGEIFEHYHCCFCETFHIGHRTNFEWIPASHFAHRMMVNKYTCVFSGTWFTNTVFSTRILTHFPGVMDEIEQCVRCPRCKINVDVKNQFDSHHWHGRKWVNLENIDTESTETLESLWEKAGLCTIPEADTSA